MVLTVHALSLCKSSKPFDQVQVGRIRRQGQQPNIQLARQILDDFVPLILGVVQDDRDRTDQALRGDLAEQLSYGVRVDDGRIRDGEQLSSDGVPSAKHIELLTAGRGPDEHSGD